MSCTENLFGEANPIPAPEKHPLQALNQQKPGILATDIEDEEGNGRRAANKSNSKARRFFNYITFILMNVAPLIAGLFGGPDVDSARPFLGAGPETRQIIFFSLASFGFLAGLVHAFHGPWIKLSTFGMYLHFLFSLGGLLLALLLSWIPPADLKPWAALLFTLWVELAFCLTRIVAEVLCVVAKVAIRCFTWCKSWWWLDCGFCPRAPPSSDDGRDD